MFGSFLPSLWSSCNQSLLGSRSRHCYAIMWVLGRTFPISRLTRSCAADEDQKTQPLLTVIESNLSEVQDGLFEVFWYGCVNGARGSICVAHLHAGRGFLEHTA